MPRMMQNTNPPAYDYYVAPYPLLSFAYGLYCDAEWSSEEFKKWRESYVPQPIFDRKTAEYDYESYIDPYPHIPARARELIRSKVTREGRFDGERLMATPELAVQAWPYILQELTFPPAEARNPVGKPLSRAIRFDANRPALSGLSMIYLLNMSPDQAETELASLPAQLRDKLTNVAQARSAGGKALIVALSALEADIIDDLTADPAVW